MPENFPIEPFGADTCLVLIMGTSINPIHGKNNFHLKIYFNNMLRHTSLIVSQIATAIFLPPALSGLHLIEFFLMQR